MANEPQGSPERRAGDKEQAADPIPSVEPQGTRLRRALVFGLLTAVVVAIAGHVAKESFGTIAQCAAVSALLMAWAGYMPREEPTEADGMSWLFRMVFRRIGRG